MAPAETTREKTASEIAGAWRKLRASSWEPDPAEVKRVCVILSAPRSGSSFLFHLLSKHPDFIAPLGEGTPFYRMMGLGWVDRTGQSDRIDETAVSRETLDGLARWLLRDCAPFAREMPKTAGALLEAASEIACRLLLQWPALAGDVEGLREVVLESLVNRERTLLGALALRIPSIAPEVYDSSENRCDGEAFGLERQYIFEEPPFIVPRPRIPATSSDLREKILLLKTSTDSYRLPLLLRLFPRAEYQFILLSRNPMGSINGLMDGWCSRGFHSHRLDGFSKLDISGYTRAEEPSTSAWWKFDLPPGWAAKIGAPLQEVCSFQWLSANQAILDSRTRLGRMIELKYESLLDARTLTGAIESVLSGLKIPRRGSCEPLIGKADSIMSVMPPAFGRWKTRRQILLPFLSEAPVRETAEAMGYDLKNPEGLA